MNPWSTTGKRRTKPFVLVVQGTCWTLTIELALAADVVVAADDAPLEDAATLERHVLRESGGWR